MAFSTPCKLGRMCAQILGKPRNKKHAKWFVPCDVGLIYDIPLSCKEAYIGHVGRCTNDRARERNLSLYSATHAHLPMHCKTCEFEPFFKQIKIAGRSENTVAWELLDSIYIKKKGKPCISDMSMLLHNIKIAFLDVSSLWTCPFHFFFVCRITCACSLR